MDFISVRYTIYQYPADNMANQLLKSILSKRRVQRNDILSVWTLLFDFVASKGQLPLTSHKYVKVIINNVTNSAVTVCPHQVFYSVKAYVFNELVRFDYNATLNRVSYCYLNHSTRP